MHSGPHFLLVAKLISVKRGATNWAPGRSCKDIRQSEDSVGDGEFWIDPAASGNAFKVYCDMTTDKGKKINHAKKHMLGNEKRCMSLRGR